MNGQEIGAVAAALAHEEQLAVTVRYDKAVAAAESCGGPHDHRHIATSQTKHAHDVNCVIPCLAQGNAGAVPDCGGMADFSTGAADRITNVSDSYNSGEISA
jgi:hypothetical protein